MNKWRYWKKAAILLGLSFWPLSLFLANTHQDFLRYIAPAILAGFSFFLFRKNPKLYLLPLLFIPIVEPRLTPLPLAAILLDILLRRSSKLKFVFLLISLLLILVNFKEFYGQTIFRLDREAQQVVIGKTYLYPNPLVARIYQNKARIFTDRLNNNLFALIDPNNYFFAFHPREITVENQNLKKFPFVGIIFVLAALYSFLKLGNRYFLGILGTASLVSLSLLSSFDRSDIILWVPLGILFVEGLNRIYKTRLWKVVFVLYFFFAAQELLRIFVA